MIPSKITQLVEENQYLEAKLASVKDELYLLQLPVPEPKAIGKSLQICGKSHHKGHRNDSRHACEYIECVGYHYCGVKKLHPEHTQKLNNLKKESKDLEKKISRGKESVKALSDFESKSETFFFSEMTPRLKKIDTLRYNNKATLFKDLRILKTAFNSKVPNRREDDETFLKNTLDTEYAKIGQTSGKFMLEDALSDISPVKQNHNQSMKYKTKRRTSDDFDTSSELSSSFYSSELSSLSSDERHKRKRKRSHKKQSRRSRSHRRKHRKINTKADIYIKPSHSSCNKYSNDQVSEDQAHIEFDRPVQSFSTTQLQSVNAPSAGAVRVTSVTITPPKLPNPARLDNNVNDTKDSDEGNLEPKEEELRNRDRSGGDAPMNFIDTLLFAATLQDKKL